MKHTYFLPQRITQATLHLRIHKTKFTKNQDGTIIKQQVKIDTSQIEAVERDQNISSLNSQNHISETKMVQQLRRRATAHIYQTSSKFSLSSFFSSPTTCCPSLPMSAPLVWPGLSMSLLVLMFKVSGSLALWTWLSVLALHLLLLSAFRSLCCSLDLPWFWIPGSPGWLELWNSMLWVTS